jgi:protein-S-isoprenylcysteine O-methyltransferase Ste14
MHMRATEFEFRYRFFIIGLVFWLGLSLHSLDRSNAADALSGWIAAHTRLSRGNSVHIIFAVAAVLCVAAAAIRTWASAYLQSRIVHDPSLHSERLVADGPYRHVRNPLYLGTLLLAIGLGAMASRTGFFALVIGILVISCRLIFREEAQLLASQGESYRRYLQAVPRLWPSLTARVSPGSAKPRWPQAFFGETFFWAFATASVGFATTLNFRFWYWPMIASLPLYALSVFLLKRQGRNSSRA